MQFTMTKTAAPKLRQNLAGLYDRMMAASQAAANMAASMIQQQAAADITGAGKFGSRWTQGLHVVADVGSLNNIRISMSHEIDYAGIFESGGTIQGRPLLWIPFSGSDAEGIRPGMYGARLFSVQGNSHPLLFSARDRKPKYFGITSVVIPQKFHLRAIQNRVMSNFQAFYEAAFRG